MNERLTASLTNIGLSVNDGNVLVKSMTFVETNPKEQKEREREGEKRKKEKEERIKRIFYLQ